MNRLLKLIEAFASRETAPVEVDDVVDYLRSVGIKDEINFYDAEIDSNVLQGTIVHREVLRNGWTFKVADIYTAASLSLEEKRTVQAKELLHILDPQIDCACTIQEVEALIVELAMSSGPWEHDSHQTKSDRQVFYYTIPVLFPMAIRTLLNARIIANAIDVNYIADLLSLPHNVVEFVMSPHWLKMHDELIAKLRAFTPLPDRVSTLDANRNTIEIHSVPLESDPYMYAKRLAEKTQMANIDAYIVESSHGKREFSVSQLIAYTPWNPIKSLGRA